MPCRSSFQTIALSLLVLMPTAGIAYAQSSSCGLTNPAFCETFDAPAGIGNRSGDLNGTLWGVSRQIGGTNFGQGQYYDASPTTMALCGQSVPVQPPRDVAICDGRLVEAQTDQHGVTSLAMYPKQPFDIAGRTGTITFDVSDDSHGNHRAWPELWYTDQPVPAPFTHFSSLQSVPRNGFGVRFAAYCPPNVPGCGVRFICPDEPADVGVVTVDSIEESTTQPVFNLEVARGSSFFVGRAGTLVHDNSLVLPVPEPFDAAPNFASVTSIR